MDVLIRNSEELAKEVNENKDLIRPNQNIRIEFQTDGHELNDVEGKSIQFTTTKDGVTDERFDFYGRDIRCWGDCVMRDFYGRCFDGGYFCGRDWNGRNAICWGFEGRNIVYYATFIAYHRFMCVNATGILENSIHKCLNEKIEYIREEDFRYGVYSHY